MCAALCAPCLPLRRRSLHQPMPYFWGRHQRRDPQHARLQISGNVCAPLRYAAIRPEREFGFRIILPRNFLFGYSFGRDSRPSRFARRRSPPRAACRANVAPHPSRRAILFLMPQVFRLLISGCPCLLVLWFAQALTEAERRA